VAHAGGGDFVGDEGTAGTTPPGTGGGDFFVLGGAAFCGMPELGGAGMPRGAAWTISAVLSKFQKHSKLFQQRTLTERGFGIQSGKIFESMYCLL